MPEELREALEYLLALEESREFYDEESAYVDFLLWEMEVQS